MMINVKNVQVIVIAQEEKKYEHILVIGEQKIRQIE